MAKTNTYICDRCKDPFTARVADRKRGWARFCSKSCKAIKQESRTKQYAIRQQKAGSWAYDNWDESDARAAAEAGWDGHKNSI